MPCNLATDCVAIRLGVEGDVLINTSVTCARVCVRVFSGWSFAYGRVARGGSTIVTRTRQRMSTSGNYFTGIFYGGLFSVDAPLPCPRTPGPGVSELFMWTRAYWRRVNLTRVAVRWEVLSSCARADREDHSGHNLTVGCIFGVSDVFSSFCQSSLAKDPSKHKIERHYTRGSLTSP